MTYSRSPVRVPDTVGAGRLTQFRHTGDAPDWRSPACSERCRRERVVVIGGSSDRRFGAQDRVYHDHAAYEAAIGAQAARLAWALMLLAVWRAPSVVATGLLEIDRHALVVRVDGRTVALSPREWVLLHALARTPGEVVTREHFLDELWPDGFGHRHGQSRPIVCRDRLHPLRMTMIRLRARLGPAGKLIATQPGLGYVLLSEPPTTTEV